MRSLVILTRTSTVVDINISIVIIVFATIIILFVIVVIFIFNVLIDGIAVFGTIASIIVVAALLVM